MRYGLYPRRRGRSRGARSFQRRWAQSTPHRRPSFLGLSTDLYRKAYLGSRRQNLRRQGSCSLSSDALGSFDQFATWCFRTNRDRFLCRNRAVAAKELALCRRALCGHRWLCGSCDKLVRNPDCRGTRDAALNARRSLCLLLPGLYIGHHRFSEGVRQSTSRVRGLPAQDRNDLWDNRGRSGTGRRAVVPRCAGVIRVIADLEVAPSS